jgi:hypothetical protein
MGESFFVDPASGTATTITDEPGWGYEKRSCDVCGSDWGPTGCSKTGCTSVAFTTSYIPPVPFMTRIQEKLAPKPAPPRATPAQVESLRALQAAVTALIADLQRSDQELIEAVRADVEELQWPQALVHRALSITGDVSTRNIDGLSLSLEALATYLTIAIKTIEEPK